MVDKETPRTLIQGYLETTETNQGVIKPCTRKPISKTPEFVLPNLNKTLPNSRSVSSKKRRQLNQEEFTPRHLIESYVATNKTTVAQLQRTKRRRSVAGVPEAFDPIIDNYTPRTNILGFLHQAPEETPIERHLKRRSSDLPDIPSNKSIHLSHDFSSNIEDEHEISRRRRSKGRSVTKLSNVKQFTRGLQQLDRNENDEHDKESLDSNTPHTPEIPQDKSIHIDFSDVEEESLIIEKQRRKSVRGGAFVHNKRNIQQFSQGIGHLSQKDRRGIAADDDDDGNNVEGDRETDDEDDDDEGDDGAMADVESDNESTGSGISGESPRKTSRMSLQPQENSQRSFRRSASPRDKTPKLSASDDGMSPVIPDQLTSSTTRKSFQKSIPVDRSQILDKTENLTNTRLSPVSAQKVSFMDSTPRSTKRRPVSGRSLTLADKSNQSLIDTESRLSPMSKTPNSSPKLKSPYRSPRSLPRSSPWSSPVSSPRSSSGTSKQVSPGRTRTPSTNSSQKNKSLRSGLDSPTGSPSKTDSVAVSPAISPRPSGKSPVVKEMSKRTVTEALMNRSKKSTGGFSPLASKVIMRKSIGNMSPVVKDRSSRQSFVDFNPKLSSTRKSVIERKSVTDFSPKLSSTRKSLGLDKFMHMSPNMNNSSINKKSHQVTDDPVPDEVVETSDLEEEEEQDTTSLDNTSSKYKLVTPYLQPRQDRPSPQSSNRRIPLKETSVNRPSPKVKSKPTASKSQRSKQSGAKSSLPASTTKKIFTHFCKMKVAKDALPEITKISEWFWKQIATDIETYAHHAGRKTIDETDVELLMKRQRFITPKQSLNVLIEKHLPLELRQELIPMARAGNKVIPL